MKTNGKLIHVGMAMQAIIAGTLALLGVITLGGGQQITAGLFIIATALAVWLVTRKVEEILIGMAMQAFIAGILANLNLITLSPAQQFTASGFFLLIAIVTFAIRK